MHALVILENDFSQLSLTYSQLQQAVSRCFHKLMYLNVYAYYCNYLLISNQNTQIAKPMYVATSQISQYSLWTYIHDCLCENPPCSHILHSSYSNDCKMPIDLSVLKCCTPKCTQMIQPLMSKLLQHSIEWLHHYEVSNFNNRPKFAFKHGGFSQGQFKHYINIANLENSLCSTWYGPE